MQATVTDFTCTGHNLSSAKMAWDAVCGADSCGSKNPCIRWSSDTPRDEEILRGDKCQSTVKYRDYAAWR